MGCKPGQSLKKGPSNLDRKVVQFLKRVLIYELYVKSTSENVVFCSEHKSSQFLRRVLEKGPPEKGSLKRSFSEGSFEKSSLERRFGFRSIGFPMDGKGGSWP